MGFVLSSHGFLHFIARLQPWNCAVVSGTRVKPLSLLVEPLDGALHGSHFALLEVRPAALATDPGRDFVEPQVIAVPIDMEGRLERCIRPRQ